MFSGSHIKFDPHGSLIPLRQKIREPPKVASFHGPQPEYIIPIVQPETKLVPETIAPPKQKKKRKTSIEGENITELTNNIIKEKPNLNVLRKAFRKMVEIVEVENEQNLIF